MTAMIDASTQSAQTRPAGSAEDPLVGYQEMAQRAGVTPATLRRYRRLRQLPAPDDASVPSQPRWRRSTFESWLATRPSSTLRTRATPRPPGDVDVEANVEPNPNPNPEPEPEPEPEPAEPSTPPEPSEPSEPLNETYIEILRLVAGSGSVDTTDLRAALSPPPPVGDGRNRAHRVWRARQLELFEALHELEMRGLLDDTRDLSTGQNQVFLTPAGRALAARLQDIPRPEQQELYDSSASSPV
ncbi:hypothetical protein [Frankia sp. R43]|uniref:hypothetical protein n=1 Tax=Frankia sp. R43 TaxID=269536 RepID=UPI001910295A|nr:hypothetical protein [Frankia sp. R43]